MSNWQLQVPVALIIFRRPNITKQVFEAVRQVKPSKLFVIADGPRSDQLGESEKCQATRQVIEAVDWECDVFKNYADVNMGLKNRVASGLDWVFNNVEEAIILEDDCLPDPSFFQFCQELLIYYRHDPKVMVITGTNFLFGWKPNQDSYYFTHYIDCWGWATWKRAWQHFDFEMKKWPKLRDNNWLLEFCKSDQIAEQWTNIFQATYDGYINSWAFRWKFACWLNNGLTIVPAKNLVSNLGFNNADSTNTINVDQLLASTPIAQIDFPLNHPEIVDVSEEVNEFIQKIVFNSDVGYLREKISLLWIGLTETQLNDVFQQDIICRVLNVVNREKSLTNFEKNFIKENLFIMSSSIQEKEKQVAIQNLLVAMLYKYAHQIPFIYEFSKVPDWLLNNYISFLITPPKLFREIGELEIYCQHIETVIDHIHSYIFRYPQTRKSYEIASTFTNYAKLFINLSQTNLKRIYKKRAEIIEFALQNSGCQLDYDFSQRMSHREKIRLGILANDFGPSIETFTTLPLYKYLNREVFEIVLYPCQITGHRLERYCFAHADAAIGLPENLINQVATIRNDDLDILFIVANLNESNDFINLLATHRLARLQVISTNSPSTSGRRYIDYYFSNKFIEDKNNNELSQYTEQLITLDSCQCLSFSTEEYSFTAKMNMSRDSLNIPDEAVVYISFSSFDKILPEVREVWGKIIDDTANSFLILSPFQEQKTRNIVTDIFEQDWRLFWQEKGFENNRLVILDAFEHKIPTKEYLTIADVYLDTYPSSSISSLIEALKYNLPTIIWEGDYPRFRTSASFLYLLNIPELVVHNNQSYIELACRLGRESNFRQEYKYKIQQKMQDIPVFFKARSYCNEVSQVFQNIFREYFISSLEENFRLQSNNLIIFPDWLQPEEVIFSEITEVITNIIKNLDQDKITLLIDHSNMSEEDANMLLSSVVMNLMMEEEIDVTDTIEIVLISELSNIQWQLLIPKLKARIILKSENKEKISRIQANSISSIQISDILSYSLNS